jgi:hypothetical protein
VAEYIKHRLESRTRKERKQIKQLEETAPEKTARKEKEKQWNGLTNVFAPKADEESQKSNRVTRHNNSFMDPQGFPHYSTKAEMDEFVIRLGTKVSKGQEQEALKGLQLSGEIKIEINLWAVNVKKGAAILNEMLTIIGQSEVELLGSDGRKNWYLYCIVLKPHIWFVVDFVAAQMLFDRDMNNKATYLPPNMTRVEFGKLPTTKQRTILKVHSH